MFLAILPLGHNDNLALPERLGTFRYGGTVAIATESGRRPRERVVARLDAERAKAAEH